MNNGIMLPSFLSLLLLHLLSSLTHAASPPRAISPSQPNSIHRATWDSVQCFDTDLARRVLPGSGFHSSFARDCHKALNKLPPPTVFEDDFLVPTVFHVGNCAVSIKRIPPEDTSRPDDPAICMYAEVWPHVKLIGEEVVETCVAQHKKLWGYVPTKTKCEGGKSYAYAVQVRVATREERDRAPIYLDRTPQLATRKRLPRQTEGFAHLPEMNNLAFGSLYSDETSESLGF